MKSSAKSINLTSLDDLFSTEESRAEESCEKVVRIPLTELHPFPNHPFHVRDDEAMQNTVDSIREYGVLTPGIVRPREDGGYEIVAGHRRKHGSELAGLSDMPCIVREMDDDIVLCRVHLAAVNLCRTFGQLLHHALLHLCRLRNLRVVDRCWGRKVKLVSSLDVRCFFEQVHQFGQIEKLRKARPCPVTRSLGVEFVKILFVDFLN